MYNIFIVGPDLICNMLVLCSHCWKDWRRI